MRQRILILGTGGNCVDILDTLNEINAVEPVYECIGFLDDNQQNWGKNVHGVEVLGPLAEAAQYDECQFVNGIGSPSTFSRKGAIIEATEMPDERFATIVHPTASVSTMARLGLGTVVFQNVTITSNVQIGRHVIVLPNTVISHDDVVGDYTCIAGGVCVSGGVTIGESCYIGTNASIAGNIQIGNKCLIGMGCVVLDSIGDRSVVVGNPARFLRKTED